MSLNYPPLVDLWPLIGMSIQWCFSMNTNKNTWLNNIVLTLCCQALLTMGPSRCFGGCSCGECRMRCHTWTCSFDWLFETLPAAFSSWEVHDARDPLMTFWSTSSSEQFRRRRKKAVVSIDSDIGVGACVDVVVDSDVDVVSSKLPTIGMFINGRSFVPNVWHSAAQLLVIS